MFKCYIFTLIIMLLSPSSFSKTEYLTNGIGEQSEDKMMQILLSLEPMKVPNNQQNSKNNIKLNNRNSNRELLSVLHEKNKEYRAQTEGFEDLKNRIITEKNNENLFIISDLPLPRVTFNKSFKEFDQIIASAAKKYQLDYALIKAVVSVESNFNPSALSSVGAKGLMQLMPATAKRFNVKNSFDASQNIHGGSQYLSWLINKFGGNLTYALAAYNAGEGNVQKYGGVPPFKETQMYVVKVLELYKQYR